MNYFRCKQRDKDKTECIDINGFCYECKLNTCSECENRDIKCYKCDKEEQP